MPEGTGAHGRGTGAHGRGTGAHGRGTGARRAFLVGPTASGKTALSLALASRLDAEILSLDSMLVYRGMDVGTAKPGAAERSAVPHHLLDLVGPEEEFSVARYVAAAEEAEEDVRRRGRLPLYTGGTPLYLKALTAGLMEGPSVPPAVRAEVQAQLAGDGRGALRAELAAGDPELHARLHPNDDKRLLRGIETLRATGRPLSAWQEHWAAHPRIGAPAVALDWPRAVLHERVARRFDGMLAAGFLDEVRAIRDGAGFSRSAGKAIGYAQLLAHLRGECSLEEARARALTLTRTLIRRQMTWLRSFPDLHWVPAGEADEVEILSERIEPLLRGVTP